MRDSAAAGNWNGAGFAAVHCAISATDALLVAKAGQRSGSKEHGDAAELLLAHIRHAETAEQARRLRQILREKNLIEYLDRSFHQDDALNLQKQAERYIAWAQALLDF